MANRCDSGVCFASTDEEIAFWKKRYEECQAEQDEFQESSRELEAELEIQLRQLEKRNQELSSANIRLQTENESLKSKLSKLSLESQNQILELQKELGETNAINERLSRYIRELEQSNDDLERAKRALDATLTDFDARLNQQIERNVLLENEIGEKEELQVVIQRLKDEAKDLRQELMIQQNSVKTIENKRSSIPHKLNLESITANKARSNSMTVTNSQNQLSNGTPIKQTRLNSSNSSSNPNSPLQTPQTPQTPSQSLQSPLPLLSPSTRISALNIVSDLLRKVGALESKLASCRNIVPPNNNINNNRNSTNNNRLSNSSLTSPVKDINANA